jgi:hypothetical protein
VKTMVMVMVTIITLWKWEIEWTSDRRVCMLRRTNHQMVTEMVKVIVMVMVIGMRQQGK